MAAIRKSAGSQSAPAWLLFVHQLPTQPSNLRVKTWRRLQTLGAVAVKNGVYVLPNSPQAREDLEWMRTEVEAMRGQATVFEADHVDAVSREELVAEFRAARREDYLALGRDIERLEARPLRARSQGSAAAPQLEREVAMLRQRWAAIAASDFFAAAGREETAANIDALAQRLARARSPRRGRESRRTDVLRTQDYRGRVWVTRPRPGIDRMSSAWLIRRWIDAGARFRFADRIDPRSTDVPFDTYTGEFSHQGDRCTFEVLVARFGLSSPALERIGRIVHDVDLKDDRYGLPEAAGIGRLVAGLRLVHADDSRLLEGGMALFEALHQAFSEGAGTRRQPKRKQKR